ncbi:retinol-binding protein 5 isoform X2 [Balaenoptera acutorostrata]|nr:retinol-binding protein 5 isoform X2 [Balaenoptera acutorostrata]
MALRKIALLLKPGKETDHRGNHVTVKTLSTFRNKVLEFEVGVQFEEDLRITDGRKCQILPPEAPPELHGEVSTACKMFPSACPKVKPKVRIFLHKPIPAFIFTVSINVNNQQDQSLGVTVITLCSLTAMLPTRARVCTHTHAHVHHM